MISRDGKDIAPFFEPESIAVIGPFREGMGLGHGTVRNLLNFGFGGRIFPVSGTCDEVLGLRTHSVIEETARCVQERGLPAYTELETSIKALGLLTEYSRFRHSAHAGPSGARPSR